MKFITEEYLKDLYKEKPFDIYKLNQRQRLTPGAIEYLSDKSIKLVEEFKELEERNSKINLNKNEKLSENIFLEKEIYLRLKAVEAKVFLLSNEFLKVNVVIARKIIEIGKDIRKFRKMLEENTLIEILKFRSCKGISEEEFFKFLEDCFEITELYMGLGSSIEIFKLETIRCDLRIIQYELNKIYELKEEKETIIIKNINGIVNSISQIICFTVGGVGCQKKKCLNIVTN